MFIRLFYSNRCEECMNLWQVINNEGIVRMFIPVCIDKFTSKEYQQLSIKEVPAIVVSVENQRPAIYEGPVRCSQWLTNFTLNRRKNLAMQVDQQRRLIQKAHVEVRTQEGGPIEYTEAEMDGVSDGYAYNTDLDIGQPKNFVPVGNEEAYFIKTPQLNEGKVDTDTLRRQLADLESSRKADNDNFMKSMESNQIRAVLGYNGN
ncbi:hypothetical protein YASMINEVIRUS_761 [Yasminevirus sp. GU-2018]|uniref:Thioredoxin n=1 Tax=Yasminevirus sp. GU-2018 TaxID=2420051 RepID=A0A5K0U8D1_9VIRU|nr:hypothetical protein YASMINEVIRUS_761 [Yasminevirus sp. GU-2018]